MKPPFQPEYVTETEPTDQPFDYEAEVVLARERLIQYAARHPDYLGRDRDLLLLRLLDAHERLEARLDAIKRAFDVLIARQR
jgi:hypothetical protein